MPSLTAWASFCAVVLPMWTMFSPWSKQSHGCSCQGCKATNHTGTFRNFPNPSSWTYASIHRNPPKSSRTFRNLPPEPTPFYTGTLRNLPEPASGTYTILQRNSPESSGTRLRNLHQHTPELSGTFRNLPPEPAPATRTGTHRSLSGLKTPLAYAVGEQTIFIWSVLKLGEPSLKLNDVQLRSFFTGHVPLLWSEWNLFAWSMTLMYVLLYFLWLFRLFRVLKARNQTLLRRLPLSPWYRRVLCTSPESYQAQLFADHFPWQGSNRCFDDRTTLSEPNDPTVWQVHTGSRPS